MFIPPPSEYREVSMSRQNFWLAAVVGAIVMFLLSFLPVLGPLIGGFVAGLVARGNLKNGAKAGLVAGIIGLVLTALVFCLGASVFIGILQSARGGVLRILAIEVLLLIAALYPALLGLVGGAVGAAIARD